MFCLNLSVVLQSSKKVAMQISCVLVCVIFLVSGIAPTWCRTFTRCSLAREMYRLGVPKSELPQWTCIAERESAYRTHVVGPPNTDGSNDYGVFQINDRYWCQPASGTFSYNGCGLNCDALLTDDISEAVQCARKIKQQSGWAAWTTWRYCNGRLPSIDDCFN